MIHSSELATRSISETEYNENWCKRSVSNDLTLYCKLGNFRENFVFAKSVKTHICDAKKSRLSHDLRILVNDRVISAFREDFIFTKLRICAYFGIYSIFSCVYDLSPSHHFQLCRNVLLSSWVEPVQSRG